MSSKEQTISKNLQPDIYCNLKSWIHNWEVRAKVIAMLVFIFGVVLVDSLNLVVISFFLTVAAVISSKIPLSFFLSRVKWVLPFLIFIFIGLILGRGLENLNDSLYFGSTVSLKALTSIMVTILTVGTQPLEDFFKGLSQLRVPKTIIAILFLSHRYVHLYKEIFNNTYRALLCRGFNNKFSLHTLKVYGEMIGAMFVKALDRSETVYKSMEAKGFDGKVPVGVSTKLTGKDVLKTFGAFALISLLLCLDWGVVG